MQFGQKPTTINSEREGGDHMNCIKQNLKIYTQVYWNILPSFKEAVSDSYMGCHEILFIRPNN
jgi:hypothetical protein